MKNLNLKEINIDALILAKGERNLTKFDKRNITRYLDDEISFNQLLKMVLKKF